MDSEAQPMPPNPSPVTGEGLEQTTTTAPASEARPTTGRKRRIQWGNFKSSQEILSAELPTYLSVETGKKEWVAELANKLVRDDKFMDPLTEKGHNAGDVRDAIWNWFHNHTPKVTKKAIPAGKNPLWEAFTKRKVSPSRLYIKKELTEVLKSTGGKKDIGLIAKVAAQQYSRLPLEQRQTWEKEAEEASKPREGQCYTNQLHAMPVFSDLFTKLIGLGEKQLGNCAFYLRFIYVDERGVPIEEEMCVSANTSLEPYTSTPDPDWSCWSKGAVNPHASPIAADDKEAVVAPSVTSAASNSASSTSEPTASQDQAAVPTDLMPVRSAGLTIPASTMTWPSTPVSVRRARRVENVPELPALNHVESLEWLRGVVWSHLESQWREAGWESALDWTIVEGDRERYLTCASFWQRRATLCPMKLDLLQCMSFYSDLASAWNIDKTPFFKDAHDASQPTPRRRVVSITPRTPRSPQMPSKLYGLRAGDIQLPAPLTLARAILSRRSSTSTLPSTPQRHRESSELDLDSSDFVPMDSASLGLTHVYAENKNVPAPWEVLDSTALAPVHDLRVSMSTVEVAPVYTPAASTGTTVHTSTPSPAPTTTSACAVEVTPVYTPAASTGATVNGATAHTSTPSPAPTATSAYAVEVGTVYTPAASTGATAHTSTPSPAPTTTSACTVEVAPVYTPAASTGAMINGPMAHTSTPSPAPTPTRKPASITPDVESLHDVAVPVTVPLDLGIAPGSADDWVPQPATRGHGHGRNGGRGRGRGYGQVVSERAPIGRTTRSKTQNAAVNENANGANMDTSAGGNAIADSANHGANSMDANTGVRHPSGSFKLKLTNNTTILAMTGAPPQHMVGVTPATGDGMKRKRKESESGGSRKRACVNDENNVQQADSGQHSRPQRNRANARPRSAMPSKAS